MCKPNVINIAISYIPFGIECVSGSIWYWLGCWVVWRSLTTSSMVAGTALTPRPPVPSYAPTTLQLSLTSRTGIVNLLVTTDFTIFLGMARPNFYSYDMFRCLYNHCIGIYIVNYCYPRSHAHILSYITTEAS